MGTLSFILTDSVGHTLYYFVEDEPGSGTSRCDGACAAAWPPVTVTSPTIAKPEAIPAALETIQRSDGTLQVTYAGRPLYRFAADDSPGETKGQGIASWILAAVELDCDCTH